MKININILVFILFAFSSCIESQKEEISVSDEFLSSYEWMIDTIYGEDEFIRDWVYFTPRKKFYRFSKNRRSYVVDSALIWSNNQVLKDAEELFSITAIDSQFIELRNGENIFRAKRRYEFDSTDIERFIKNNELKLKINGKWHLDSMEIEKARMPSFCKEITVGAIFDFQDEGELIVYEKDSIDSCNKYSYSVYEDKISLTEWDMIMSFPIEKLDKNELIIKSKFIPRNVIWTEDIYKARQNGFNMYFKKVNE